MKFCLEKLETSLYSVVLKSRQIVVSFCHHIWAHINELFCEHKKDQPAFHSYDSVITWAFHSVADAMPALSDISLPLFRV